jgi:3'(2'), 5'-bisphosphate nucleotidase
MIVFIRIKATEIHIDGVIAIAREAGQAVMEVYSRDFSVEYKSDNSPLTLADQRANEIIAHGLRRLSTEIPIISEEAPLAAYEERCQWEYFWLVDPLDGTKEFVSRTDEFTINIALVRSQEPVLGVVYAPALGVLYYAVKDHGSFKIDATGTTRRLDANRLPPGNELVVIGSRSHHSQAMDEFIERQRRQYAHVRFVPAGSALKFCLVAEGQAHVYPRLAPTREWDTAAAHVVATESNRRVLQYDTGEALTYNKPDLLNPWLICN